MRFNLKTTRPVPAATEAGEIWLKRGESIECTAQVAAQLILEDYAEPTDEHELRRLLRALDEADRRAA